MPATADPRTFVGYRLDANGVPTCLYEQDGKKVEDTLRPAPKGNGFEHIISIDGKETKEAVSW